MELACIYGRVSGPEQKKGYSLAGQVDACRDHCAARQYRVARIFQEVHSGRKLDRPALDRLLDLARRGSFSVVVVRQRDRFGRHKYTGLIEDELRAAGVRLEIAGQGPMEESLETELHNHQMDGINNYFARVITRNCMAGKVTAAKLGHWPLPAPPGYRRVEGRLVVDEQAAQRIRDAYWACIKGANRYALGELLGVHPTHANRFIKNPANKGQPTFKGITVPLPPIVDAETWRRAVDELQARFHNRGGPGIAPFERREYLRRTNGQFQRRGP